MAHPDRYPVHKDEEKGQVFGGECNRTACDNRGARWYNIMTHALYCNFDGRDMAKHDPGMVIEVDEMPSLEEQDRLRKAYIQRKYT